MVEGAMGKQVQRDISRGYAAEDSAQFDSDVIAETTTENAVEEEVTVHGGTGR